MTVDQEVLVRDFRITPFDAPIGVHLPERLDWRVVAVSAVDMADGPGSEVHRFRHWGPGNVYVRIVPPKEV